MPKEMLPELLDTSGDFIFKIGIGSVIVIIIYFIFNLFSKLREINDKLDSFLTDFKPAEAQEYSGDVIEDITDKTEKKNERDFALWKKAKVNEPEWGSPWGKGRPGWHIECSAMAGAIFKDEPIDIHSGGLDLKFPHHDNEIAQSEAYYGCDCWIKYWFHTGPLTIENKKTGKEEKLSKSLGNFIPLREMLTIYSPRQIRMLFLLHQWDKTQRYDREKSFPEAIAKEESFNSFFKNVKATLRQCNIENTNQNWNQKDYDIQEKLMEKKFNVRKALSDNFNTPRAI